MTYLQLVNAVLKRLREPEVTTVTQNEYSALIGELVNDAKRSVEMATNWEALREDITITTSQGTQNYVVDGIGEHGVILDLINDTDNKFMHMRASGWMLNKTHNIPNAPQGSPSYFTIKGIASDGDVSIDLWQVPDGVYTLIARVKKSQNDFSDGADVLLVPSNPVIQLAFALALRERGEAGGQTFSEQLVVANSVLSSAIAIEANRHPEDLVWSVE